MRLTSEYTRVAAPHDEVCPYIQCGKNVKDWFIEWYSKEDQIEIGHKNLAMDCPWCRRAVFPHGLRVITPVGKVVKKARDIQKAEEYAKIQIDTNGVHYPDLISFLSDPVNDEKVAPYKRGYWSNINIP